MSSSPTPERRDGAGARGARAGRDRSAQVFVISVAAQLADLHPQTLRNYEKRGLVEPGRTDGGNRMYSEDDIERLQLVAELSAAGMNLTGIEQVLALRDENEQLREENRRLRARLDATTEAPRSMEET